MVVPLPTKSRNAPCLSVGATVDRMLHPDIRHHSHGFGTGLLHVETLHLGGIGFQLLEISVSFVKEAGGMVREQLQSNAPRILSLFTQSTLF